MKRTILVQNVHKTTLDDFVEISALIYARTNIPPHDRKFVFECGTGAHFHLLGLFKESVEQQLVLAKQKLVEEKEGQLTINPTTIRSIFLPNIGVVELEHNMGMDLVYNPDQKNLTYKDRSASHIIITSAEINSET